MNTNGLLQHLSLFSPPPIIASNIDFVWNSLKQVMLESRDLFVSKSRLPTNVSPKWFNSENTIHRVRYLHRKVRNSTTTYQLDKLEEMENHLQCLISDAKESYLLDMVSRFKDRPRALFSYFSRLTKVSGVPNTVHLGDLSASLSYDKANLFNSFFHSVMTNSDYCLPSFFDLPAPLTQLHHITISSDDVHRKLVHLDASKAPSIDDLHPAIVKLCASSLLPTHISVLTVSYVSHNA